MATSREVARDALVTLLTAALVPGTVNTVTGYQTPLGAATPLVWVLSVGSEREALTYQGNRLDLYLDIYVWVPLTISRGAGTHPTSMDALDDIEQLIAGVLEDNLRTANWDTIEYADRTEVFEAKARDSDMWFYQERIPIKVFLVTN